MSHTGDRGPVGPSGSCCRGAQGAPVDFPVNPTLTLPQFLQTMNNDLQNEWTHLQFYLYHASHITGLHAEEYKEFFTEAAKGEMEHVQAFLDRLLGLNFNLPNSSGKQFPVFTKVEDALWHAVKLEEEVVENYAHRLVQLDRLLSAHPATAAYLKIFYEDQLQDSYEDAEKMRRILADTLALQYRRAT
jgi:bacterioferritin (cytochrome b1)